MGHGRLAQCPRGGYPTPRRWPASTRPCSATTRAGRWKPPTPTSTLTPGPSPNARPRVAGPRNGRPAPADAARDLSAALATRRHAAGLNQKELAALAGYSVTTVGHAETGRTWQARRFWEQTDKALNAGGELLDLHDRYRAAAAPPDPGADAAPGPPTLVRILLVWSDGSTTFAFPDPEGDPVD
jgi:Helix-turn-helix domain